MKNPNAPYPGRQLFLGLTSQDKPCFGYLVSGRSPASRERMAIAFENGFRIGPVGVAQYDPLRHYSAVKYDAGSGILAVSNGIQTEAIFETYKLIYNTGNHPGKEYMEKLLDGAGSEPDPPINTARIAGIITNKADGSPLFIIGNKVFNQPAKAWQIEPELGIMYGISTYKGDIENPEPPQVDSTLPEIEFTGKSPEELSQFLFDISETLYKGADIRVCTLGGVRSGKKWDIVVKNVLTA